MELRPVPDAPALRLVLEEDERDGPMTALVVAELHLGVETEMARAGARLASSTDALADRLIALAREHEAARIIVAGDFKQTIPELTWQERREVPRFLQTVTGAGVQVHVVMGNHDGGLALLVPPMLRDVGKVFLSGTEGIRIGGDADDPARGGGVGIFHGHAWPADDLLIADELVSAHTHPAVALVDDMGHAHVERCWVRGPVDPDVLEVRFGPPKVDAEGRTVPRASTMTLVPPFNPLLGGAAVNVDGLLGPAGKMMVFDESELFLLDGTRLGRPRHLPEVPEEWRRRHRRPKEKEL